ncbi:MAG: hypothetical protein ACI4Q9_03560 [Candidatus Methanomethylophilaceae archaeon]
MTSDIPVKVQEVGLEDWYGSLGDMDRVKLNRYIDRADPSSVFTFFLSLIKAAVADENYRFGLTLCVATSTMPFDMYQRFLINEEFIEVLVGREMYADAKNVCNINLEMFPEIRGALIADNGGKLPDRLAFRNRYIDVIVGVEYAYDEAFEMLKRYNSMGILSDEDLEYRTNSIRTHRLQRSFDGVYTYRKKDSEN